MSNGFRSRRQIRVPRRLKSWDFGPGTNVAQAQFTAITGVILTDALSVIQDGATLLRLRGQLIYMLDTTSALTGGFTGAFGIGIATQAAVAAGAASVPLPVDEQDFDGWIFWRPFSMKSVTATIADGSNAVSVSERVDVDTKAMRKLREGDSIYAALQITSEVGSAVMQVFFDSRILIALP